MGRRNFVHKHSAQRLRPVTHVDRKREAKRSGSMCDLNEMADELRQNPLTKCVLCGDTFKGMGANPSPLADSGECCDYCDTNLVIPARITQYMNSQKQEKSND